MKITNKILSGGTRFFRVTLSVMATALMFTSCTPKTTENPAIISVNTVPSGATTASPGTTLAFKVTVSSDNDLKGISIKESINGSTSSVQIDSTFASSTGTAASFEWKYTLSSGALDGEKHVYTFLLTDDKGNTAEATYTITVSSTNSVNWFTNVTLGAQNNINGSFYNTSSNTVYAVSAAKANQTSVDIIYYYGATNLATLSCPAETGASTFTTFQLDTWMPANKNSTNYIKLNGVDFTTTSTSAEIKNAYLNATGVADLKANQLSANDVVAFKTKSGKYGIIKVNSISNTDTGTLNLDVKVQK